MSEKNNKQDSSNERSIFSSLPEKFNILDEEVDVAVQFEYIRQAKKYKKSLKVNTAGSDISEAVLIENYRQELFSEATEPERLKRILIELANNESPAAFRLIESFLEVTPSNLRSWTLMAFQECKMGIESQLLGERPVYVSTGLGGKDNKLRYSIAFRQTEGIAFEDYQQKLLQSEVVFSVGSVEGVVEESVFDTEFAVFKVLIPSSVPLKEVFDEVISNCNTIVEFVSESVIITNYKNLLPAELRRKREAGEGDSDGLPFELDESFKDVIRNFIKKISDNKIPFDTTTGALELPMDEEGMEMLNGLFESLSEEMLNTDGNKTDDEAESENEDI